jgi:hypothetical protein
MFGAFFTAKIYGELCLLTYPMYGFRDDGRRIFFQQFICIHAKGGLNLATPFFTIPSPPGVVCTNLSLSFMDVVKGD